jgi:hypothetical protein
MVIEDGQIIRDYEPESDCLWWGDFSYIRKNGFLINFILSLNYQNVLFIIPRCDGNINRVEHDFLPVDWQDCVEPYIRYAKEKSKVAIVCTLAQIDLEKDVNYLYLPLDDNFFEFGCMNVMKQFSEFFVPWERKNIELCWRGRLNEFKTNIYQRPRIQFVKKLFDYKYTRDIKLIPLWNEIDNFIDTKYFSEQGERLPFQEFFKYKIFFIIDGNVIASNHMWAFSTGCIVFMISNAKCWFSEFLIPGYHYIHIKYDLSDLIEKIEWVIHNDSEAAKIAQNGKNFCEFIFSSEFQKKYIVNSIQSIINQSINK